MKWTLQDFIYFLRKKLDEMDEDLYSNDELTAYINEAILDMSDALNLESYSEIALASQNTIEFKDLFYDASALPADREENFAGLRSLYLDANKLNVISLEEAESGRDGVYLWGGKIHSKTPLTGTLKAYYIRQAKPLLLQTDTSEVPSEFQHIALEYAVAKCRQKDGEYGQYDYDLNNYRQLKTEMKKRIEREKNVTGISLITISDYMG